MNYDYGTVLHNSEPSFAEFVLFCAPQSAKGKTRRLGGVGEGWRKWDEQKCIKAFIVIM